MNERIRALMEKRASAVTSARALLNKASNEGRDMTSEELGQYNGFDAEIDKLTADIQREERMAEREAQFAGSANGGNNPANRSQPGGAARAAEDRTSTPEYRQSLLSYLVTGESDGSVSFDRRNDETRSILGLSLTGVGATGGVLAPTALERVLLDFSAQHNVMRRLASVRSSNSDVEIPYSANRTVAYHLDEGADFTPSTPSFDKLSMSAYKTGALSVVTIEAMQDMFLDLENWIRDDFGVAFATLEETDFVKGTGDKQPRGFLLDATAAATAASATAISTDELIDIQHALKRQFRKNATWLMNDATLKIIRKLKTGDGQFLWQPGLQAGQPTTLLGRPVETSDDMDAAAAGKKAIAYGDFSWYRVLDRRGLYIQRLNELYATSGQVGFLAYKRYDAKLLDANAIQLLTMHA
ncbi:MAG: phage major capsid protein [Clostridia bacterium]|nr:phage major capsid protein [Clostridia bacterium]